MGMSLSEWANKKDKVTKLDATLHGVGAEKMGGTYEARDWRDDGYSGN